MILVRIEFVPKLNPYYFVVFIISDSNCLKFLGLTFAANKLL